MSNTVYKEGVCTLCSVSTKKVNSTRHSIPTATSLNKAEKRTVLAPCSWCSKFKSRQGPIHFVRTKVLDSVPIGVWSSNKLPFSEEQLALESKKACSSLYTNYMNGDFRLKNILKKFRNNERLGNYFILSHMM